MEPITPTFLAKVLGLVESLSALWRFLSKLFSFFKRFCCKPYILIQEIPLCKGTEDHFNIAIVRLNRDDNGQWRDHVKEALDDIGVNCLVYDLDFECLLREGTKVGGFKWREIARNILRKKNVDLLFYGEVITNTTTQRLNLKIVSNDSGCRDEIALASYSDASSIGFDEGAPEIFYAHVKHMVASKLNLNKIGHPLEKITFDNIVNSLNLLINGVKDPNTNAFLNRTLAGIFGDVGQDSRNKELLEKSVEACKAAFGGYTQNYTPLDWAITQGMLANTYLLLGNTESNPARYISAKDAYEQALSVFIYLNSTLNIAWIKENLGTLLGLLGESRSNIQEVEKSIEYAKSAKEILEEFFASDNSDEIYFKYLSAMIHLSIAYVRLFKLNNKKSCALENSLKTLNEVNELINNRGKTLNFEKECPVLWMLLHVNLGFVYLTKKQYVTDEKIKLELVEQAKDCFHRVIDSNSYLKDEPPIMVTLAELNLAETATHLTFLGNKKVDQERYSNAVTLYENVLKRISPDNDLGLWRKATAGLGATRLNFVISQIEEIAHKHLHTNPNAKFTDSKHLVCGDYSDWIMWVRKTAEVDEAKREQMVAELKKLMGLFSNLMQSYQNQNEEWASFQFNLGRALTILGAIDVNQQYMNPNSALTAFNGALEIFSSANYREYVGATEEWIVLAKQIH